MLRLVLDDPSEDVSVPYQGVRRIQVRAPHNLERVAPHLVDVLECLVSIEQWQVAACPARVVEGVVHLIETRIVCGPSVDSAQQPQFFEVADVAEVPHQRTHDRVVLAMDVVVVQGQEHLLGTTAIVLEARLQLAARLFGRESVSPDVCRHNPLLQRLRPSWHSDVCRRATRDARFWLETDDW